jgi:uncharacterized protein YndB with AHSA1/START domain
MHDDPEHQAGQAARELTEDPIDDAPGISLRLSRHFETSVEDLWAACTSPDRLRRWLGPVEGELRVGGSFSIIGQATGVVRTCEPPYQLTVTWDYGPESHTEVELRLREGEASGAWLELRHTSAAETVNEIVDRLGPIGPVGIGGEWEVALGALDRLTRDPTEYLHTWRRSAEAADIAAEAYQEWSALAQVRWGLTDEATANVVGFAVSNFSAHSAPEASIGPSRAEQTRGHG